MPKPEDYSERTQQLAGWPVRIVTYRLAGVYRTTIDNTDPGAWVVKTEGSTKQESETKALAEATALLEQIKKQPPPSGCISVPGF